MLLCLFVFLWKILRNMSTISATIQQEQQLELLRLQLLEHQRRKLRHLQKMQQQQQTQRTQQCNQNVDVKQNQQIHYQKLRKLCRDKQSVKENFLLHKFLFGGAGISVNDVDPLMEEQQISGIVTRIHGGKIGATTVDKTMNGNGNDKDGKFLRMSEHPNIESAEKPASKFVLSHPQNHHQYLLSPHPSPVHRSSGSHRRQPLQLAASHNTNFWTSGNNQPGNGNGLLLPGNGTGPTAGDAVSGPQLPLNENNLKSNVQIVLDNINRNYYALREQLVLNNQNGNNNNNNVINNKLLQQRLSGKQQQQQQSTINGPKMASPDSDTNCNPYCPAPPLSCSIASSQDFSHDYSDYQWFMDYGYRDGVTHQSILSALSASYNGIGELSYYEDLAKNIDANLAEVDMENFRTEDIHSLLTTLPSLCNESAELRSRNRNNNRDELVLPGLCLGGGDATGGGVGLGGVGGPEMDNSICKSELLFSPVRESHISVDSLDMDGYPDEEDIILTCQANKNNYTIAFEQSVLYSDESYYDGPENYGKHKQMNLLQNLDYIIRKKAQDTAMSASEVGYTTWSKLRKNGPAQRLSLATTNPLINQISRHAPTCFVRKSLSMPDLKEKCLSVAPGGNIERDHSARANQLNVSQAAHSTASGDSYGKQMRTLLPMFPVPADFGRDSPAAPGDCSSDNNEEPSAQQPSFNLVKLFIKQKSSSTDTCMDVSSGCWPSDSTNSASGGENNNSNTNLAAAMGNQGTGSKDRCRKKSMNDSGKCSTVLGRHEEEEFQFDSLDAQINNNNNNNGSAEERAKLNDFNSPAHKRNYKAFNLNIANKNLPAVNPVVYNLMNNNNNSNSGSGGAFNNNNNNNSSGSSSINNNNNNHSFKDTNSDASRTSENLTQIFNNSGNNNNIGSGGGGSKTKVPIEMITKSMQTSFIGTKEKVRVIPPSFLERLNKLGDKQKAPVFVVYPNYVLPDLGFLNTQHDDDVHISPMAFKDSTGGQRSSNLRKPRPVSMNDIENLRAKAGYKHVLDWKSLVTLLPVEYRKLLRNIPEAVAHSTAEDGAPQKPLFCMTPPLRRNRGVTCDCMNIFNTQTYNSSSSGGSSSQPPSSGYRGSSTMLTDSEMDLLGPNAGSGGFNNNLYVYQYDSPAEVASAERPPSGRAPPKGILRRTTSLQKPPAKAKRNSMFEENHKVNQNVEKRRSLQEPCYNFATEENFILEDSINELPELGIRKVNNSPTMSQHHPARLPNTPKLPSADDYHRLNKLNELNDIELNKAVSSKLNRAQQQQNVEDDLEARIRAEHFLSNVPKSELKHYAEIAHILETTTAEMANGQSEDSYDRSRLRHEVSRALSQRKNVSFNQQPSATAAAAINTTPVRQQHQQLLRPTEIKFSTPPNSPNMSVTHGSGKQKPPAKPTGQSPSSTEREKQDKIQSNRFKRLQIQWELLSKENQLQQNQVTTPTGAMKSRIPRPVSYPTTRANSDPMVSKTLLKSPSRIVPPKRYHTGSAANVATMASSPVTTPPTPAPRTPSKLLHTTPKKSASAGSVASGAAGGAGAGMPRPATRTRLPLGQTDPSPKATSVAGGKLKPATPSSKIPSAAVRTPVKQHQQSTSTPANRKFATPTSISKLRRSAAVSVGKALST
ncbi:uncharacterized protein LOC129750010 isoform X2 [Uranotaenia lowii]|uniref:uncharacterized protein LOC129750010 isoform X2 n=1 Tax=Uranotaenia lowii TaxID=190385 RepID=UPI00247932F4|nr:uncharacterized protein LOC129750010 isoform X2 [Uranotaenia lowii]